MGSQVFKVAPEDNYLHYGHKLSVRVQFQDGGVENREVGSISWPKERESEGQKVKLSVYLTKYHAMKT
jgi:hypothetical protein